MTDPADIDMAPFDSAGFWARIMSSATEGSRFVYTWESVTKSDVGYDTWVTDSPARTGSAYNASEEPTGVVYSPVPLGAVVWVWPVSASQATPAVAVDEYWFNGGSGGGGTPTGDVVCELWDEWSPTTVYRAGEKVCYKPAGHDFYFVYSAVNAGASATTPNTGGSNWTLVTSGSDEAVWNVGATYTLGEVVRYGTTYQERVYTCAVATSTGESPTGFPASWTPGDGIVYGITQWPPLDPITPFEPIAIPYSVRLQHNARYNESTHRLLLYYTDTTYNSLGIVTGMDAIVEETQTTAVEDVD